MRATATQLLTAAVLTGGIVGTVAFPVVILEHSPRPPFAVFAPTESETSVVQIAALPPISRPPRALTRPTPARRGAPLATRTLQFVGATALRTPSPSAPSPPSSPSAAEPAPQTSPPATPVSRPSPPSVAPPDATPPPVAVPVAPQAPVAPPSPAPAPPPALEPPPAATPVPAAPPMLRVLASAAPKQKQNHGLALGHARHKPKDNPGHAGHEHEAPPPPPVEPAPVPAAPPDVFEDAGKDQGNGHDPSHDPNGHGPDEKNKQDPGDRDEKDKKNSN